MPSGLSNSGAVLQPSDFAPLHLNRMVTGMWSNSNPLRDASTPLYVEKYQGGRQDRIKDGRNTEISPRLTLERRKGFRVYNSAIWPRINRFYSWNTFSTTDEHIKLMVDTAATVYDGTGPNTQNAIWQKSPGAGSTYFLGVGNVLYFTNGVDNKQWHLASNQIFDWGVNAPTTAPVATQALRPNPYGTWLPNTGYTILGPRSVTILDSFGNWQQMVTVGLTGNTIPSWSPANGGITQDNQVQWINIGYASWQPNHAYSVGQAVRGIVSQIDPSITNIFWCVQAGTSGAGTPGFIPGLGNNVLDGGVVWENGGVTQTWSQNVSVTYLNQDTILDSNGYIQKAVQFGRTNSSVPTFATGLGGSTQDATVLWKNTGPYAVPGTAPQQYGYAFKNSTTKEISNMSPKSLEITVRQGNEVTVRGDRSGQAGIDTIVLYRIQQGGSTFLWLAEFPNPPSGQWTFVDNIPDSGLNPLIQAQVAGEGTPLPAGATCLEYHLGRPWAAVGNVVYMATGPDAAVAGANGNAGFSTTFTMQSKVIRLWANSLGMIVFTVRDAYLIAPDSSTGILTATKWIENIPLLSYDAFTVLLTTPYLFTGNRIVATLDSGAGIVEMSFPIADQVQQVAPSTAYCTFHTGPTGETALYLANGQDHYFRMSPTSAPETGIMWHPMATPTGGMSALQSTEIEPGVRALLMGPQSSGPILMRDPAVVTDNGTPYEAHADFGSVVLALPGQLAGLAWMTLESKKAGSPPKLGVLLNEIEGEFEDVPRTRQDPTNLPPSNSLVSNRHSLLQNQNPVWCRHMQYSISWPAEDAANELLTTTIFGQTWQEQRSQQ